MVIPESLTGSKTATGVKAPVLPTWIIISFILVVACLAGNLYDMAQRGNLAVLPRSFCFSVELTFITIPSTS